MSHNSSEASVLAFSFEVRSLVTDLNGALTTLFRPLGLTCVQAEALMALDQLGPATLKRLGEHLVAESGHPSRLVSKLVADGLVARRASESDGRAVVLELTDRGRDLAVRARAARAPLLAEFSARFGGRLDRTTDVLRDVRSALTGADPYPVDERTR